MRATKIDRVRGDLVRPQSETPRQSTGGQDSLSRSDPNLNKERIMLKVAVVGMGGIGNIHASCHRNNPTAELVAVCDVIKAKADEAGEKHDCEVFYSLAEVLDAHPDIDIVDVTTGGNENGSWHYEPTMQALRAGKNVLVEKPISNDINQAREMVKLATEKNLYLGCNLNHTFTKPADEAKALSDEGKLGEPIYCLHRMGFPGGESTYPGPATNANFEGFRYAHVKAFLAHPFSIMRYFCGDIVKVQAFMGQPGFRRHANDPMVSINSIHVLFANGTVGYLFSQRGDATMGLGGWWSVEVGGSKGTFCIENCVEKLTFYPTPGAEGAAAPEKLKLGQSPAPVVTDTGETDFQLTFQNRIDAFLEDVDHAVPKDQLRASGRDALATLEYTWAAIESYEQDGIVIRPHPLPPEARRPE
ncbi:MAG: gfo/Idh/MocA family oxidoreductase [Verrucomicrobia bacterium]|nr:MAG: gfo/Idh/MocA family oxidoreductase [Verrucomicrobiota bacterium]